MIELRFHPSEKCKLNPIVDLETPLFPTAYVSYGDERRGDTVYQVISVSFYFKENVASCCCWRHFPNSKRLGYHKHDVEYVNIYYKDNVAEYVFFSAHSPGQGSYVRASDVEINDNGFLVVYVALNSHALYPRGQTYIRAFGLANDYCSADGKRVPILRHRLIPAYDYTFENGINLKEQLRQPVPSASVTPVCRFFLPFFISSLRSASVTDPITT